MLSGEGNENDKKTTTIGLISKKATLHVQHTFFVNFFAVLHFYGGNVGRVLVHPFFTVAHFHPGGLQHSAATKFHFVPPTENVSFCLFSLALSPFLVEPRWPAALLSLFLCLSLSLRSKFKDMTINVSLILKKKHGYRNIFRFPFWSLLTLQLCLLTRRGWPYAFPPKQPDILHRLTCSWCTDGRQCATS